ncbi:MAG: long-chain fatty acid--CoA ligase [Chloroflexi bacterium]|nr:long-chain fatty acid--CoA ligase [Chloroflexota bacterium]
MRARPWLQHYDQDVPATIDYPAVPLHSFLERAAQLYPQRPCTIFHGAELTYSQMNALVERLARGLAQTGIHIGDRVGVMLPNIPQFVAAFYAILKAGAIVVAINPQYKAPEVERQVNDAGVTWLIALDSAYQLLRSIQPHTEVKRLLITSMDESVVGGEHFLNYDLPAQAYPDLALAEQDRWLASLTQTGHHAMVELPDVGPDDVAIFQYTGGTTGIPKAAIGLHRNLVANTLQFRRWLVNMEDGKETLLAAIPMFHVYGMVLAMSLGVAAGASLVIIHNPRDLEDLLSSIEKYKATIFPGVPTMYNAINHFPGAQQGKYQLRSIKACISGSSPLLRETKDQFEALTGGKLVEGYGLSEAPTATHCNPILGENRPGSIGLPLSDVDAQIVDLEDGNTVLVPGETGELVVRGPQVMSGYHHMAEETAHVLQDSWLHTGDIGRMDVDGYFYIVDRKKDLIKVGGLQVWPREVEEVIAAHPAVQEVGVAGIPDTYHGEIVKAWVVLKSGKTISADEILAWCEASLSRYKIPRQVEFRDELPKTTVGKILRRELVRQHLAKA